MNKSETRLLGRLRRDFLLLGLLLPAFLFFIGISTYSNYSLSYHIYPWFESLKAASPLTILLLIFVACQFIKPSSSPGLLISNSRIKLKQSVPGLPLIHGREIWKNRF
ncbi:MAG: hypothetical protein ACHQEM_12195 [Chitinophagales bacterium]